MRTPKIDFKTTLVPAIATAILALGPAGCGEDSTAPSPAPDPVQSGLIDGLVLQDGAPVGGITALGLGSDRTLLRSTVTDDQGRFAFAGVAAGSYRLWVTPPDGYAVSQPTPGDIRVDVDADRTSSVMIALTLEDSVEVPPEPTGTLIVSAHDGEDPVSGVYLSLSHEDTGGWAGSGRTDINGVAEFALATGSYEIVVIPSIRYEVDGDAAVTASVTEGQTTAVAFSLTRLENLPPGQLLVYAEADSLPVAGVTVYALDESATERLADGVTDERGRVAFPLDEGAFWAEIELPEGYDLFPGQPNPMGTLYVQPGHTTWAGFSLRPTP